MVDYSLAPMYARFVNFNNAAANTSLRFFQPIKMATGVFWDSGLGFPNPMQLALWESSRIWPNSVIDVVITLGTGMGPKRVSNTPGSSISQLWNSFIDFLDGEARFRDFENGIGKTIKVDLFRFNTKLHGPMRLDNVKSIDLV